MKNNILSFLILIRVEYFEGYKLELHYKLEN